MDKEGTKNIDVTEMIPHHRFLVTGGAGFIGSSLSEFLLRNNAKFVRIFDNLSTGYEHNIDHLINKYPNCEFLYGDLSNYMQCTEAVKDIDIVFHQGALGSVPRSLLNPIDSHRSNSDGTFNIFMASKEAKVKRVVYASSSSVYGDDSHLPKTEHSTGNTLSIYAATKVVDEIYAQTFNRCFGLETIGLRYFNVFGPRQDPKGAYAAVIPKFIKQLSNDELCTIYGDGSFSRDFTYIDNVIQANIKAGLLQSGIVSDIFGKNVNVGAGERTTILELFTIIKKCMGCSNDKKIVFGPVRSGDVPHSHADISLAVKYLGYKPCVNVLSGITKMFEMK